MQLQQLGTDHTSHLSCRKKHSQGSPGLDSKQRTPIISKKLQLQLIYSCHSSVSKSHKCLFFSVWTFNSITQTSSRAAAVSQQPTNEYHQDHTAAFCSSIIEQLISPSHTHFIPFLLLYQWKSLEEKKNWDRLVTPFHI